jgi:hypothetical protein
MIDQRVGSANSVLIGDGIKVVSGSVACGVGAYSFSASGVSRLPVVLLAKVAG